MIPYSMRGKITALNGDREDPSQLTFRVLPDHSKEDFYPQGVGPAEVIIHANTDQLKGLSFGDTVHVEGNLSYGVSRRKDQNNPNRYWDNYRCHFSLKSIKKVQ